MWSSFPVLFFIALGLSTHDGQNNPRIKSREERIFTPHNGGHANPPPNHVGVSHVEISIAHKSLLEDILARLKVLRETADSIPKLSCRSDYFLTITHGVGRTGNNLIQYSHGLWFAAVTGRTFLSPVAFDQMLTPFDLKQLKSIFCICQSIPDGADLVTIDTPDVYSGYEVWRKEKYTDFAKDLPPLTEELVLGSISDHNRQVAAALWGNVDPNLIRIAIQLIVGYMGGSLSFVAAHKRSFEGACFKIINHTDAFAIDAASFPNPTKWISNPAKPPNHLCDMPLELIDDFCNHLRNTERGCEKIFLAWDGQGSAVEYGHEAPKGGRVVVGRGLLFQLHPELANFVDMFVCVVADVFIMNPLSTWSWNVAVPR